MLAALVVAALFSQAVGAQGNGAGREALLSQLNSEFQCKVMLFNQGERLTFGRQTSIPECTPLKGGDYARAVELLNNLAAIATPVDAETLRAKANEYASLGPGVAEIRDLAAQLRAKNVITRDGGQLRVRHIGHPFEREDETRWLQAYVQSVQRLVRTLGSPADPAVDKCPQPACDPELYAIAEAVTLRPPLDLAYLREGSRPVAPSSYGLSYFSQRYAGDTAMCNALGLDPDMRYLWAADNYHSRLNDDGALVFDNLFLSDRVVMSVADWKSRTEYPYVVPIFYLFQEARHLLDTVRASDAGAAAQIRDIRFAESPIVNGPRDEVLAQPIVSFETVPGGYRLVARVLHTPGDVSAADVRKALQQEVVAFLKSARQVF